MRSTSLLLLVFIFIACKPDIKSDPDIFVKEGFVVQKLFSPSANGMGSWVSITKDNQGRLIASDQYGGMYYIEVPALGSSDSVKVSAFPLEIGNAQGLLWAYNSLYVMQSSGERETSGLYRITDSNDDGELDNIAFLHNFPGRGEHGPHGLVLGPDGYIYMSGGNHTDLPQDFTSIQKPIWQEDQLFDAIKDPRGHANSIKAPGGWIARTDEEGKELTVIASGFRNAYDMAFNKDGELFTFDSDMEWDMGSPWYRPTRVCHVTPGAEFGWRTGSGKWPAYYPDNVPGVIDIGQGSPTGLVAGKDLNFPAAYEDGLFIFDWSFGTMYYIALSPEGSSYTGTKEEFLSGAPLPLTDGVAGDDGAMYFTTGGRRLDSYLYRVYYNGTAANEKSGEVTVTPEQELRRKVESLAQGNAADFDMIWEALGSQDRRIRYSARVGLEYQDINTIAERFAAEKNVDVLINAALAIARVGDENSKTKALETLLGLDVAQLNENQQLDLFRVYGLLFIRGDFEQTQQREAVEKLSPLYPSDSKLVNWELVQLLAYWQDPEIAAKTLNLIETDSLGSNAEALIAGDVSQRSSQYGDIIELMKKNSPPSELMHFVKAISYAQEGWTPALREEYFKNFAKLLSANGGESYNGFVIAIRDIALDHAPEKEKEKLKQLSGEELLLIGKNDLASLPQPKGPGKNWDINEVVALVESDEATGDLDNGAQMFRAALCSSCHSINGQGNSIGPDLTQIATRFSTKDLAEAIIMPNKAISDQYTATELVLNDESFIWGTVVNETEDTLFVNQNPMLSDKLKKIAKSEISERKQSDKSVMMPALINRLNAQEVKDLIHFIQSSAKRSNPDS
ncbi:c-type cytochrome [Fulvivirgaceae bacterium BMA12]|uniref:C-type cytochrome n=1 Tax=Agaribacillus aureus TaxID=3051825 RepID=A0ABT8L9J5_9BACT|nr:c-type cytochrome [Fulvivirgaceae bacterium BMA12]